jgi:hypothetical protein
MEPCIICTESSKDGLKLNSLCACKYYIHDKCWTQYMRSTPRVRCLMCRKDVNSKTQPLLSSSTAQSRAYYSISTYQLQPSAPEVISYQELRSTISQSHSSVPGEQPIRVIVMTEDTRSNLEGSTTSSTLIWKNSITTIIVGVILIVSIIVLLILLL